jgi:hypothetical protein
MKRGAPAGLEEDDDAYKQHECDDVRIGIHSVAAARATGNIDQSQSGSAREDSNVAEPGTRR